MLVGIKKMIHPVMEKNIVFLDEGVLLEGSKGFLVLF